MKSFLSRLGGTFIETLLLKAVALISPWISKPSTEERQFWIREGVATQVQAEVADLRNDILKHSSFFEVPNNSWLMKPIGVASKNLATALEYVINQPHIRLLQAETRINLGYESEWSAVESLNATLLTELKTGKSQLVFVDARNGGSGRRMIPLVVWKTNNKGNLAAPSWNGVFSEIGSEADTQKDLATANTFKNLYDIHYPIDAVYLWVDGNDPNWLKKKNQHSGKNDDSHGQAPSRFISRNELYFSIRSLIDHAGWVNKIWVVTDGQTPDLGELAEMVTVIDHTDFIPQRYLPTFNSHVITANLHRIPGLSEHFLYLNDDVFFGRNLHPGIWFDTLGRSVIRYTKTVTPGVHAAQNDEIQKIRHNTVLLANDAGYLTTTRSIQHGPHPLQKSIMQELWERFEKDFELMGKNKFRAESDMVPEWLHNFAAISSARAYVGGKLTYNYLVLNSKSALPKVLALFVRRLPSVLCLNDVSELPPSDRATEATVEQRLRAIAKVLETKK